MSLPEKLSKKIYNIPFIWILTILIVLFFVFYSNAIFNGFVWDDEEQIVNNSIIHSLSNFGQIFSGATFGTGGAGLSGWFFRPFLTLSYMLLFAVFELNAWGYHLIQLLIHGINAILIFKILQSLINKDRKKDITLLNALIAMIFAIHPALTEAVSYIAALSEPMYTLFNLIAFYLIIKTDLKNGNAKIIGIISSLLLFGMLFKESSIIIFPILACYVLLYRFKEWKKWTTILVAPLVTYFLIRLVLMHTPIRHPEFAPISEASLITRIITIPKELYSYLHIIFYPDKLAISQHFVVTSANTSDFYIPLFIGFIFVFFILFLSWKFKSKIILFGLIWFLFGFGLISNLFPIGFTIAERWLYFPLIGFTFMTAGILYEILNKIKFNFIFVIVTLFALLFPLGIRTIIRNSNWQNGLILYSHDAKVSLNSFDLENNLGVELFRNGNYSLAKIHFERSIKLQPKWYLAYNNLGAIYQRQGNLEKAKELYKKTLSLSDYYLAYENLAGISLATETPQQTIDFTINALKRLPYNANLNRIAALAYFEQGATSSAKLYAQRSFSLNPSQENYFNLQKILSD